MELHEVSRELQRDFDREMREVRREEKIARRAARAGPIRVKLTFKMPEFEKVFETYPRTPEHTQEFLKWKHNPNREMPDWLAEQLGRFQDNAVWEMIEMDFKPL